MFHGVRQPSWRALASRQKPLADLASADADRRRTGGLLRASTIDQIWRFPTCDRKL